MKRKIRRIIIILCALVSLFISACASSGINLAKKGFVDVVVVGAKSFDLEKVAVYQEDNNAIVKGQVWLTRHFLPGDYGHIDVEILDAQNTVTEKHSVFHKPRTLKIIGNRPAFFKASLSSVLQPGSRIRVAYHQPDNNVAKAFCSK